jgi:hypothetical protein
LVSYLPAVIFAFDNITGDIAVSPITAAAITGFSLIMDSGGQFSTASQVTGKVYAADYASPTPSKLTTAVSSMETAYTDAAGRIYTDDNSNLYAGNLGDRTLVPGVYTFDTYISIDTGTELTFDAENDPSAVFIIQTTGNVLQAANTKVILAGGAKAENIFWQVAGFVYVGAGAHMEGVLLAKTAVTFITGSSLNGRILTQTACTLQIATITEMPVRL